MDGEVACLEIILFISSGKLKCSSNVTIRMILFFLEGTAGGKLHWQVESACD